MASTRTGVFLVNGSIVTRPRPMTARAGLEGER